jgi:hypothetical protein
VGVGEGYTERLKMNGEPFQCPFEEVPISTISRSSASPLSIIQDKLRGESGYPAHYF